VLWIYGRICRHVSSKTLPALNFFQLTYNQNFNIIGLILVVIHHSPPKQVITSSDLNDYLLIHPESTGIAKNHLRRSFLLFASFLSLPYVSPFPYSYVHILYSFRDTAKWQNTDFSALWSLGVPFTVSPLECYKALWYVSRLLSSVDCSMMVSVVST